jgi:hypothetical protein
VGGRRRRFAVAACSDEASHDPLRRRIDLSAAGSSFGLVPKLNKLPGFVGYYPIEAGNGVFGSLGLFETPEQGKESSNVVASWIRDEKLETLIPTPPKITSGEVIAHSAGVKVA